MEIHKLKPGHRYQVVPPVYEAQVAPMIPLCPLCGTDTCAYALVGDEIHVEGSCGDRGCEQKYIAQGYSKFGRADD
jgi:hypothetical protein